MGEHELQQLEGEAEAARARLARDLSTLRSPKTYSDFAQDLKQEALETKDALVNSAKSSFHSTVQGQLESLKARAAENPTAALLIGAGIAWRLYQRPPIATALIGAGLLSLFRTTPPAGDGHAPVDHLSRAKIRLQEQVHDAAVGLKEEANVVTDAVSDVAGKVAEAATEQIEQLADEWTPPLKDVWQDPGTRDRMLIGAASLGVVAALGIVCSRRLSGSEAS